MNDFPWWILIPVTAIIVWGLIAMSGARSGSRRTDMQLAEALQRTAESNRLLAERIDQLDRRLASVEKTLNDVP